MKTIVVISLLNLFLLPTCSKLIQYSPFDIDVKTIDFNRLNINRISVESEPTSDTLKFALFADTHENYDDMADAIASINKLSGISFVLSAGDITSLGLASEYNWYYETALTSVHPIISCIGNHDCLSNGSIIFEKMFGHPDVSFVTGNYKFILFNNIVWENNNNSPRYQWLREELFQTGYHNILVFHIPPKAGELGDLHRMVYDQIVDTSNAILSLHGHFHKYEEYYHNGVRALISDAIDHREYYIISLVNKQAFIKRVIF